MTETTADPRTKRDRLDRSGAAARSRAAFAAVLARPCSAHAAPAGSPCWCIAGDTDDDGHPAVCFRRIRAAGFRQAPPRRRRERDAD